VIPSFLAAAGNQGAGVISFPAPEPIVARYRDFGGDPVETVEVLPGATRISGAHTAVTTYGFDAGGAISLLTTIQYKEVFGAVLVDSIRTPALWRDLRDRPASAFTPRAAPPASGYTPRPGRPGSVWNG
jgi:pimeloyl-ACP methyl ester carboxylesterase